MFWLSLQFIVSALLLGRKTSAFAKGERDGWLARDAGDILRAKIAF